MPDAAKRGIGRQIDAPQAHPQPSSPDAFQEKARRAAGAIVSQLVDAFEDARQAQGLSVTEIASQAHLSKRSVGLAKAGTVVPSLPTLVSWAEACGLELDIRVRLKRSARAPDTGHVEDVTLPGLSADATTQEGARLDREIARLVGLRWPS